MKRRTIIPYLFAGRSTNPISKLQPSEGLSAMVAVLTIWILINGAMLAWHLWIPV